jgi:diaminohydroxyphosphoribosylaminopyrimidine deaminase/5-amino-6-(5-phosphoribosylamino)uracil reductase
MRLAVDQAALSPADGARVGAVVVRDGEVLFTGHKSEDGPGRHAELVALDKAAAAGVDLRGATAFVTLEPCANNVSKRAPCAERLAAAGITTVYIGRYDRMFRVQRQGWKTLTDRDVRCRDFDADFRDELDELNATFDGFFLRRNLSTDGNKARFDYTQNGGRIDLATDDSSSAPVWTTTWGTRDHKSVYAKGGTTGIVAHPRFAREFDQIDDPDAYDFENHFAELEIGEISIWRNQYGHALVRLIAVEPPPPYGTTPHVSVTIDFQLRPKDSGAPDPAAS